MKQVSVIISTYAADVSGVCSALYELGGMVVIHDPSGCNSTYNTHDEPRWYEKDSLVFISGLSQMDAIMGNDEKFIRDIVTAARQLSPRFIALVRSPIPLMIGTDFEAIAKLVKKEVGIPVFYFPTDGMHSYIRGVSMGLSMVAQHLIADPKKKRESKESSGNKNDIKILRGEKNPAGLSRKTGQKIPINILGVTPLDFSINSTFASLKKMLLKNGFSLISSFAMGSSVEEIAKAFDAQVNLVVSAAGLDAAKVLWKRFQIPYVVGLPVEPFGKIVEEMLKKSAFDQKNRIACKAVRRGEGDGKVIAGAVVLKKDASQKKTGYIIGEAVISASVREAMYYKFGVEMQVICPLEVPEELREEGSLFLESEEEIKEALKEADWVIADPMYQPICPKKAVFYPLPHEAFSGRIYRKQIPDLMWVCDEIEDFRP